MKCECCKSDLGKRIELIAHIAPRNGRLSYSLKGDLTTTHHKILKGLDLSYCGEYDFDKGKSIGKKYYHAGYAGFVDHEVGKVNEMIYRVWTKFPQLGIPIHVRIQYEFEKPIKKVLIK